MSKLWPRQSEGVMEGSDRLSAMIDHRGIPNRVRIDPNSRAIRYTLEPGGRGVAHAGIGVAERLLNELKAVGR